MKGYVIKSKRGGRRRWGGEYIHKTVVVSIKKLKRPLNKNAPLRAFITKRCLELAAVK